MKTMAVVAHHRNHCYRQTKPRIVERFGSYRSRGFTGVSYRNFEPNSRRLRSEEAKSSKQTKSAISPEPSKKRPSFDVACSDLFAGPIYLNSPPPSSVPLPKFSLPQKSGVSLELPLPFSGIELEPRAKSAPSLPTGDDVSTATENL